MPIIGHHYDPAGFDSVYYLTPANRPKELGRIRFLLMVAAFVSMYSAGVNLMTMVRVYSTTKALAAKSSELLEDQRVRTVVREYAPALLEEVAEENGRPVPTAEEIEQAADMGVDALRMSASLSGTLMLSLLLLACYFPIKYLMLIRRAGYGHPESIRVIRTTARAQIAVELYRNFTVFLMNADSKLLELPNGPSPTLLVAGLILFYIRREHVKEYFSDFRVVMAPKARAAAWKASLTPEEAEASGFEPTDSARVKAAVRLADTRSAIPVMDSGFDLHVEEADTPDPDRAESRRAGGV